MGCSPSTSQPASAPPASMPPVPHAPLVPMITVINHVKSYAPWEVLFDSHAQMRAGVCDEPKTVRGKASETVAIVLMHDVDLPKFMALVSAPEFRALVADVFTAPPEFFVCSPPPSTTGPWPQALQPIVTVVHSLKNGYEPWAAKFDGDSHKRADLGMCLESKTMKMKISESVALALLFDVNLRLMMGFVSDPAFAALTADVLNGMPSIYLGNVPS
eukprot:gnl/Spiro4/7384_TR3873_c0_g1_i1.p1 gnl/Spiro4/7384_TR3873_c0_g1~~gnl/Spiro4/7384_TR3873_c0_g1_i1.p1  ORF type:complete len:216 (-),score=32.77 gnl/Spiro4/7384_TR3873_c0_g1_i1:64-711(-)